MDTELKRAKARVERAAVRWWRVYSKDTDLDMDMEPADRMLMRALAALDKLTKGKEG